MLSKKDIAINEMLKYYSGEDCFVSNIINYSDLSSQKFVKEYNGYIQIFEHSFDLLTYSIDIINFIDKKNWKDHYLVQYILISNSLGYLYGTFDSMARGFYTNSNLSLRAIFETLIKIYFISWNPNEYSGIYGKKFKNKNDKQFNLMNVIEQNLKNNWDTIYHTLSLESHSNTIKTLQDIEEYSKGHKIIKFNLEVKPLIIKYNQNILLMILYALLVFINDILMKNYSITNETVNNKNKKFEFDLKMKTTLVALKELMSDIDETKFNNLYKDVAEVMKKLKKEEGIT